MAKKTFLDFEQPIADLESKIEELRYVQTESAVDISDEIDQLAKKSQQLTKDIYSDLTPWQVTKISRHPERPYTLDYIHGIFTDFVEMHGDRHFADDLSIVGGLARFNGNACMVLGQQKGRDTKERTARNFGMTEHMDHAERYARAREFHDVVTGLWDSFAEDAFIRDKESGVFWDPARMHKLNHEGKYLSIAGPLNIARPVQGWPVIVQAGASDSGRQLAAEVAEMIFAAGGPMADARAYYADIKSRAAKAGRDPTLIKILPGALVTVAESDDAAREKRALLDNLVHPDSGIGALSISLGVDARGFDLDAPLPEIPETNQSQSGRQRVLERARRENLTVRQLAVALGGYGGLSFTGSAKTIADEMQAWLEAEACDGFNIMFPTIPGGVEDFVRLVVPELQRRGIFRREYAGTTLRDHLGLPRPRNQFF